MESRQEYEKGQTPPIVVEWVWERNLGSGCLIRNLCGDGTWWVSIVIGVGFAKSEEDVGLQQLDVEDLLHLRTIVVGQAEGIVE